MELEQLQSNECDRIYFYKKQVYVVDDDDSILRAVKLLMVSHGFIVNTYSSSEDFFSAIPNSAPGCLILDIHLSGLNGWDAQQRLIKKKSNRPVIIITADKNDGLEEKALKAGALGFLQKPFNGQELVDLVNLGSEVEIRNQNNLWSISKWKGSKVMVAQF